MRNFHYTKVLYKKFMKLSLKSKIEFINLIERRIEEEKNK